MKTHKVVLISLASFMVGAASVSALIMNVGEAERNGSSHDHPFIKGMAWISAKYITKDFDPNTEPLG